MDATKSWTGRDDGRSSRFVVKPIMFSFLLWIRLMIPGGAFGAWRFGLARFFIIIGRAP